MRHHVISQIHETHLDQVIACFWHIRPANLYIDISQLFHKSSWRANFRLGHSFDGSTNCLGFKQVCQQSLEIFIACFMHERGGRGISHGHQDSLHRVRREEESATMTLELPVDENHARSH